MFLCKNDLFFLLVHCDTHLQFMPFINIPGIPGKIAFFKPAFAQVYYSKKTAAIYKIFSSRHYKNPVFQN